MIYFTDAEIDHLISEDLPFYDLTSLAIKLGSKLARISYATRNDTVLCGTEETLRIFEKFKIEPTMVSFSGEHIGGGIKFLEGEGLAKDIHSVWRLTSNIMGYASGISTRMRTLLALAQEIDPEISIVTTRKSTPFTKKLAVKAVHIGGGSVHRLGLSDSILIFDNHIKFIGGIEVLKKKIETIRQRASGRNITVEVKSIEDALSIADSGIEGIQLDKLSSSELKKLVPEIRKKNGNLRIAATGNITTDNIQEYAKTGVDVIVTSGPYYGIPADFKVSIEPVYDI